MTTCVLSQPTLVLNKSWVAIDTTPVRDALRLLCKGAAKAVQPDTYEVHGFESWADLGLHANEPRIRTVRLEIPVPEENIDYDADLEPIVETWTSHYAATDEKHDPAEFDGALEPHHELALHGHTHRPPRIVLPEPRAGQQSSSDQ